MIYLVRHAKSDWNAGTDDFDRPLNERGKKDAPMMAIRLLDRKAKIDRFVSSPAKRAFSTAWVFASAYDRSKEDIVIKPDLYLPSEKSFFNVISTLENEDKSVAIFSHNSGISEFANQLGLVKIDNMPTCCIFAFGVRTEDWSTAENAEKQFMFFDFPKKQ